MDGERPRREPTSRALHARACFAAHDEGDGLFSLYLTPCAPEVVANALEDLSVEVLHGGHDLRFPPALLAALQPPLQVTSHPGDHDVLVAPHAAVPPDPDAFAVMLSDPDHGVIHARTERVLVSVLRRWLAAHLDAAGVGFGLEGVDDEALRALVAPLPDGSWKEPRLSRGRRVCTLDFPRLGPDDGPGRDAGQRVRWIGAERSGWRTDWAW